MLKIVEVGPRDGLQNETAAIATDDKIKFINALSGTGVHEIEVSAFVSPRWVPQLGDAREVFDRITRKKGVIYSALVPNERGLDGALAAKVDKIAVFTAASETFNRKNINASIKYSIQRFRPVVARAAEAGLPVRGYISTAFWCAFEGRVAAQSVLDVTRMLTDIGVDEVSISDTVGKASPDEVEMLLNRLLPELPAQRIAMHFHDTYGKAISNVLTSWDMGIRTFDTSAGGLGGCPYSPGATGNVSTESVVQAIEARGERTGVDLHKLATALRHIAPYLIDELRSKPEQDLPACASCEYATEPICCRREASDAA
jgi:hydroxymethylglutaryl-CoA lyase